MTTETEYTRRLLVAGPLVFESERFGPVQLRRLNPRVWKEAENFGFTIGISLGLFVGFVATCGLFGVLLQ